MDPEMTYLRRSDEQLQSVTPDAVVKLFEDIQRMDVELKRMIGAIRVGRYDLPVDAEDILRKHVDVVNRVVMYMRRKDVMR